MGSAHMRGRGLPGCGLRGDRPDLDEAEPERPEPLEPRRVLVEAGGDAERAGEDPPERLDAQRRIRGPSRRRSGRAGSAPSSAAAMPWARSGGTLLRTRRKRRR